MKNNSKMITATESINDTLGTIPAEGPNLWFNELEELEPTETKVSKAKRKRRNQGEPSDASAFGGASISSDFKNVDL